MEVATEKLLFLYCLLVHHKRGDFLRGCQALFDDIFSCSETNGSFKPKLKLQLIGFRLASDWLDYIGVAWFR